MIYSARYARSRFRRHHTVAIPAEKFSAQYVRVQIVGLTRFVFVCVHYRIAFPKQFFVYNRRNDIRIQGFALAKFSRISLVADHSRESIDSKIISSAIFYALRIHPFRNIFRFLAVTISRERFLYYPRFVGIDRPFFIYD